MYSRIKDEELNIPAVFNMGFGIYTKYFKYIFILGLLVYVPTYILYSFSPIKNALSVEELLATDPNDFGIYYLYSAIELVIYCVFMPLISGGTTCIVLEAIEQKGAVFSKMINGSLAKIWKHTFTSIAFVIVIMGCTIPMVLFLAMGNILGIFFMLPVIYMFVNYYFYTNVVGVTNLWGYGALLISLRIVKGRWFKTFGFLMLVGLFSIMVDYIARLPILYFIPNFNWQSIFGLVYDAFIKIINTYFYIVTAVWFLNRLYSIKSSMDVKV